MPNPSDKLSEGEGVAGYTPGPWVLVTTPNPHISGANWREIKVSEHGQVLAEVFHDMGDDDPALLDDEAAANARLIAAAPDLAEACRYARDLLLNHHDNAQAQMCVLAMIDAALSRLTPSKE